MQPLLEMVGILVILLLVMRFSLRKRSVGSGLPVGVTALNLVTGALTGMAVTVLIPGVRPAVVTGQTPGETLEGFAVLVAALRSILPFAGAALGGLGGYFVLGLVWNRLVRQGLVAPQIWMRRLEFTIIAVALVLLFMRLVWSRFL